MKKIIFLSIAALSLIIVFGACQKRKHIDDETAIEASSSVDTAAEQKHIADSIAQAKKDSAEFANFTSLDLQALALQGHVKELSEVVNYKWHDGSNEQIATTFSFDKKGTITNSTKDNLGCTNIERDSKGQLSRITYKANNEMGEVTYEFDYTSNNGELTANRFCDFCVYDDCYYHEFNKKHWPITMTYHPGGDGDGYEITFNYLETDSWGNWTKRVGKNQVTITTTRKITYYTPKELK